MIGILLIKSQKETIRQVSGKTKAEEDRIRLRCNKTLQTFQDKRKQIHLKVVVESFS